MVSLIEERERDGGQMVEVNRGEVKVMSFEKLHHTHDVLCLCDPKLSSQHALACLELKEVQERLRKTTDEMRRRDRLQEEHQRENRRLKEEHESLQRHRVQLEDELQELRYRKHPCTTVHAPLLHLNTPLLCLLRLSVSQRDCVSATDQVRFPFFFLSSFLF